MKRLVGYGILFFGCHAFGVTELLRNGSFEEGAKDSADSWGKVKYYRVEKGAGMNGTRGLVFENHDDKDFYRYPSQKVEFKTGQRYQYSVVARSQDLNGHVGLCVEWYDVNGKWLSGCYQSGLKGTHDWSKLQGVTPPIPSEAVSVRFAFFVSKGGLGKVWFDDASVRPLSRDVFGGLYSSAYRNLQMDGLVRFHAAINCEEHPGASVYFSYLDAGCKTRRVRATRMDDHSAVLEMNAAHLARGTHPVSCELLDASGKRLGDGTLDFTRPHVMPKRRTWINGRGRAIVDGKPFFPLGIYIVGIDDNLRTGPFNCVMPYKKMNRETLDRCRSYGLDVIYPLNSDWAWHVHRPKGMDTDEDAQKAVEREVLSIKGHPAILAWYVNDEISIEKYPQLLERQRLLERIDPDHPTWTVLYQFGEVRSYYPTFDVIGTDPYPIPQSTIGNVAMWTRTTREEVMGLKPMWQVPQAFGWEDFDPKKKGRGRFPTREELVNMTWQCLANGANGIVYWCYRLLYQQGKFRVDRWADICAAASSMKPYMPVFLSDEDEPAVSGASESISVRAWRFEGKVYLAVVNNTRMRQKGVVGVKDPVASVALLQGAAANPRLVDAKQIEVALDGLGYAFLRLD